ncbi:MAG: TfoX/Sxy family protein [Dongiaceae bacterium]
MARTSELLDYLLDELAPLGRAQGRALFSGHGVYLDGLIVGIVIDETLYLKVDDGNRPDYEAAGMQPFTYSARSRRIALSYWEAPAEVLAEPEALRAWADRARAAARRAGAAKAKRRR